MGYVMNEYDHEDCREEEGEHKAGIRVGREEKRMRRIEIR